MSSQEIDRVCGFAEKAVANDQWWFRLGFDAGRAEGRHEVEAELEADWRQRQQITPKLDPNAPCICELRRRREVA